MGETRRLSQRQITEAGISDGGIGMDAGSVHYTRPDGAGAFSSGQHGAGFGPDGVQGPGRKLFASPGGSPRLRIDAGRFYGGADPYNKWFRFGTAGPGYRK